MAEEKNKMNSAAGSEPSPNTAQNHKKEKKANKKKHAAWFRGGIIAAVAVLFFAVITGGSFSLESVTNWIQTVVFGEQAGDGYPVPIPGTKLDPGNFVAVNGRLAVVTDTSFTIYNQSGAALASLQHGYNTPVLKAGKDAYLIYDLGGKHFRIVNSSGMLNETILDAKIFTGVLSDSGFTAIATDSQNYCSEVAVYNANHEKIFSWSSPVYRATALALDSSGRYLAAAGVAAENGEIKSAVYIFDLSQETPLAVYEFPDNVIFSVCYLNGGSIAIVGDTSAAVLSADLQTKTDYSYNSAILHGYSIEPGNGIALLLSNYEDGQDCRLVCLNKNGGETFQQPLTGNAVSVFYSENGILALSSQTLSYYSLNGALQKSESVESDIKTAVIAGNFAYLLGASEIRQMPLS